MVGSMLTILVRVFLGNFSSQNEQKKKNMHTLTLGFGQGIHFTVMSQSACEYLSVCIDQAGRFLLFS